MEQNHQEITNPNSEGALVIKLKMAKDEEAVVPFSDLQGNRKPETLAHPRICHLCKKVFSSGKALGGHMRMHAQEAKGLIKNKQGSSLKSPKPKNSTSRLMVSSSSSCSDEHVCIECSKVFPSKKSLYGHMRSHPDRPYRGIEPPNNPIVVKSAKNSSTSTLSDANLPCVNHNAADEDRQQSDSAGSARVCFGANPKQNTEDVPNLNRVMPSWRRMSKRGRKDSSFSDDVEELDMSEAVKDLMMFAQANPTKINNKQIGLDLGYESEEEEEFSDNENLEESIVIANVMSRRQRKKVKLEDLISLDQHDQKVYACSQCSKSFQSHQALGGHVSSHNKIKNKENYYSSEHDDDDDGHQCGFEDESHQSRMCNKIFATGQALGGHMRSHSNGSNPNEQALPSQTARKGLVFDLNEPPPTEYDDQEQGNGCNFGAGYATSYDSVTLS